MKVNIELDLEVKMGDFDPNGTGCRGYLLEGTTYDELVRVFGEPLLVDQDKTKVEWIGKINGLLFTIYDYKSKVAPEENTDWHIGGNIELTAELVKLYFENF